MGEGVNGTLAALRRVLVWQEHPNVRHCLAQFWELKKRVVVLPLGVLPDLHTVLVAESVMQKA